MYINIGFYSLLLELYYKCMINTLKTQINAVVFRKAQFDFGKDKRVTMF